MLLFAPGASRRAPPNGPAPLAARPRTAGGARSPGSTHQGGISTGSGPVVTRFGFLALLPTRLDTPLMPIAGVRSRPTWPLGRRYASQPGPAQPMSPSARHRGQPVIASSPARADPRRDPRPPAPAPL